MAIFISLGFQVCKVIDVNRILKNGKKCKNEIHEESRGPDSTFQYQSMALERISEK